MVLQNESFAYVKKIVLLGRPIKKEETSILNKQIVKLKNQDDYRWSSRQIIPYIPYY
jgi:hypothetical protein